MLIHSERSHEDVKYAKDRILNLYFSYPELWNAICLKLRYTPKLQIGKQENWFFIQYNIDLPLPDLPQIPIYRGRFHSPERYFSNKRAWIMFRHFIFCQWTNRDFTVPSWKNHTSKILKLGLLLTWIDNNILYTLQIWCRDVKNINFCHFREPKLAQYGGFIGFLTFLGP